MQDFALSYEKILQYIALHPDQPCLVHCSAGKDLTGAFTAPPLMLLGVEDSIVEDYAPTTIGLKQFLPVLMVRFNSQAVYEDNWKGTLNMGGSNPESTRGFITHVNKEYECRRVFREDDYFGIESAADGEECATCARGHIA